MNDLEILWTYLARLIHEHVCLSLCLEHPLFALCFLESEIGVFVELAGSTFGEDDLAAHKSLYLHNALNGYLPLIYDIDSEGADYEQFLAACV